MKTNRLNMLRPFAIGLIVALWTTAGGLAAPVSSSHPAHVGARPAADTAQPTAQSPVDALYGAMERLAQALHGLNAPSNGGLPKLRAYTDASKLANEILGIASTLDDQAALTDAVNTPITGPDDGRHAALADLLQHFNQFDSILARLAKTHHGNDSNGRFNALVDLARLLDVEPKNKPEHKFNPKTAHGQVVDKKNVRSPLMTAAQFQAAAAPNAIALAANSPPTSADLAETDEVQLTINVRNQAQQLGNNPLAIRNWVYNNIDFVPGFGATQNSQRTLLAKRGNAFDVNSLLIALLRAAGTPARYVYGTVDLPADQARNWIGDVADANAAADLLTKAGIPTTAVVSGGTIRVLRIEHVWVEAYVDFSPSRGARNVSPNTWVPMDASFKGYATTPGLPVQDHVSFNPATAQAAMLVGAKQGADWITGIDPTAVQGVNDQITQQVASYVGTQTGLTPDTAFGKRAIVPNNSPLLEGSLPYAISSAQTYRYDALPSNLQQTINVSLYDTSFDVDNESPEFTASMPLARLGAEALKVNYVGATATDASVMQQYVSANSQTLSAGSLNVKPQLTLGATVLNTGGAVAYGTQQYWRANIIDSAGAFATPPDPSVFPAGTSIAFVADTTGTTPEYTAALTEGLDNTSNLPIADALALGGIQYFLLHDYFDDLVAQAHHAVAVRLPSVGTFATAARVSYFFGVPRTGTTEGFVTDVKGLRFAIEASSAEEGTRAMIQMGSLGSLSEGMTWSLLTGRDVSGSLSAATLLLRANEAQIPIYNLNSSNINQDLPALGLNSDDITDISNAVAAGNNVVVPAREMRIGSWSGVGYLVVDPTTGAGLWRVSGGLNGGIDVGCIEKAISLNVLCKLMFTKLFQQFINSLNPLSLLAKLGERAIVALVPVVGEIVAVVQLTLEIIDITMQVLRWVRGIMNMIEELQQGDLEALGITALNDLICSIGSPCFGGGGLFGGAFGGDGGGPFGGFSGFGGFGGGAPGEPAAGNPVAVGTGVKWQWERDYDGDGAYPLHFVRTYNSLLTNGSIVGNKWSHTYQSSIHVAPAPLGSDTTPATAVDAVLVQHGDGTYAQYARRGSAYVYESNLPEPLVRLTDSSGNTAGWEVTRITDEVEHYDSDGRLQWVRNRAGLRHTLAYNANHQLLSVSDDFGRSLQFGYDAMTGQMTSMTDPAGKVTSYGYDSNGNATSVSYSDGKSRTYLYEDVMLASYMTGIIDERNIRLATFAYDYRGRAVLDTHALGAGKLILSYGDNTTTVTDSLGAVRTYTYTLINQRPYLIQVDQPCTSGCSAGGVSAQTFDGNGFVASKADFNGNVTTFSHNARGLIESRTDAYGTALARTTTAQWHPTWHLPAVITEPLPGGSVRTDTFTYDGTGSLQTLAFAAPNDNRTLQFTNNAHGQVLTATSPRTDIASAVRYTYNDATGNRSTMKDEVGHQTTYDQYDAHGQLKQKTDANGLITKYGYDLRGRLTDVTEQVSASDAGELTKFHYDPAGNLDRLTLPDSSFLGYTYDDAQRLTDVTDSLGNHVHYTLDGVGNRTQDDTSDPSNNLAQTMSRVMDALGHLQELHGALPSEVTKYTYDGVGNEKSALDPLSHVTGSVYDALNRLQETDVLDPADPDHAVIGYGYDVRDNLTSVTDPRHLQTTYVYSGFDELNTLISPDTGTTGYQYDLGSNLTVQTDARNARGVYAYDAANRLTQILYGTAGAGNSVTNVEETLSFGYDEPAGGPGAIGRLTHADVSGTPLGTNHLAYLYDTRGRVTQKTQQLRNAPALVTNAHYNAQGQKDEVTLPSGAVIAYTYGADGRVLTITVNGVVIVKDVAYFPFGDPAGWTEQTNNGGAPYTRGYDTDGRVNSFRDGSISRHLGYDPASRVTAIADFGSNVTANWTVGYDDQDRLISANNAATAGATANLNEGFAYDATGNRKTATTNGSAKSYTTDLASNKLNSVGSASRTYDAAGNTTSDGSHGYVYSARNRLKQSTLPGNIPLATYAYDAWGERIVKQGATTTQFVYDEDGHLIGEYNPSGQLIEETIWLDDTPVVVLKLKSGASNGGPSGSGTPTAWQGLPAGGVEVFWIESDQLDTPRAIVNATHQLVWQWDGDPFGTTLANENPSSLATFNYNLRFPGQYYDQETGTHYNYFRDYEPGTGRYLASDPIGLEGGIATYGYVASMPIDAEDLDGLKLRRPGFNGGTKKQFRSNNGGKCSDCQTKPIQHGHHEPPYTNAELRKDAEELICLMGNTPYAQRFGRRMYRGAYNDLSIISGLCEDCHQKRHKGLPKP